MFALHGTYVAVLFVHVPTPHAVHGSMRSILQR